MLRIFFITNALLINKIINLIFSMRWLYFKSMKIHSRFIFAIFFKTNLFLLYNLALKCTYMFKYFVA